MLSNFSLFLLGLLQRNFLQLFDAHHHSSQLGLVAQRITRLTTDQKIAGSNPAEIENFLF